ncbi:MAG: DUF4331 domain-containing protein [Phycisphaerales bacterium]
MNVNRFARRLGMCALAAGLAVPCLAADHREAPAINQDPAADLNDVYAFPAPGNAKRFVLAMTVNPFTPITAPLGSAFSPNVRYRFAIDHDNDGVLDRDIQVTFTPLVNGQQTFTVKLPDGGSFSGQVTAPTTNAAPNAPVIVDNGGGVTAFCGPTDDPFFFDSVGFNRFRRGVGTFNGNDGFAGFNVSTICIELPVTMLGDSDDVFQVWALTERQRVTLRRGSRRELEVSIGPWEQIERTGNPAISTVLIPGPKKDLFNLGTPDRDGMDFGADIVASLQGLGTDPTNIGILASVAVPDTLKVNLSMPSGYPNGRRLEDDVVDTLLFFIFNQTPTTDGANANDATFSPTFPYFAPPQQPPA